jgi:hypothetical protein
MKKREGEINRAKEEKEKTNIGQKFCFQKFCTGFILDRIFP